MDVIFLKSLRPLYCDYISRILCVRRAQQGRPPRPPFMYFYSRPYARGDSVRTLAISSTIPISTRAPTRGATAALSRCQHSGCISTHAPTRGATGREGGARPGKPISTPAPTRGAICQGCRVRHLLALISTHAPTRGATYVNAVLRHEILISTPAPTRGATKSSTR